MLSLCYLCVCVQENILRFPINSEELHGKREEGQEREGGGQGGGEEEAAAAKKKDEGKE